MSEHTDNRVQAVLDNSHGLPANQRLLLVIYANADGKYRNGAVEKTAQDLAKDLGWAPTVFSRTRKELIEAGFLEQHGKFNNVKYFRLTDQALGRGGTVVRLRTAG